jgi:hypothetical protein
MNRLPRLLLFFTLVLASCSSVRYIDIQVLNPSEITPHRKIDQLYIIRSLPVKNAGIKIDTGFFHVFSDSLYPAIAKKLAQSPALINSKIDVLSMAGYRNIYPKTDFNARKSSFVVFLDSLALKDTLSVEYVYDADPSYWGLYGIMFLTKFYFKNMAIESLNKTITLQDTMEWEYPIKGPNAKLTYNHANDYKDLANYIADDLTKKIVPYWNTSERVIFFASNHYMRHAYNAFIKNDLDEAIYTWSEVYNKATRNLASKAAFNIALTYEIKDELTNSRRWLDKALEVKKDSIFYNYRKTIDKRLTEKEKIDKQLWKTDDKVTEKN